MAEGNTDTGHCSHDPDDESESPNPQNANDEIESVLSKDICTNTIDLNVDLRPSNIDPPLSFNVTSAYSYLSETIAKTSQASNDLNLDLRPSNIDTPISFNVASAYSYLSEAIANTSQASVPLVIISRPSTLFLRSSNIALQPCMPSNLPSLISLAPGQPQTLFLQALSKLNQTSLSNEIANHFNIQQITDSSGRTNYIIKNKDLSPPDSLTSAPPSYSFVLRQMAVRRRPRIVGTFIPSPSFVQQAPPPNYAAAFDIYLDNPMPPAPPRVYNFGFASMPVICPDCGYTGMTVISSKITLCTHLCAVILCVLCCWICAPLPYILRSCKDVHHYCRNCRNFLGMYCPTNPENAFT